MIATASADPPLHIRSEQPSDAEPVEALLDRAFGPGRFTKSSERVREFAVFRPDLSFCAWDGNVLVGSVRMWSVQVGGRGLVFLGPLAVEASARKSGVGGLIVEQACQAAARAGFPAVLLVGDEPYFQRFGFSAGPARDIRMPGPVDQRRVLVRELAAGGGADLSGDVVAP
jgi:predicted N-acetyltransferase YhbS